MRKLRSIRIISHFSGFSTVFFGSAPGAAAAEGPAAQNARLRVKSEDFTRSLVSAPRRFGLQQIAQIVQAGGAAGGVGHEAQVEGLREGLGKQGEGIQAQAVDDGFRLGLVLLCLGSLVVLAVVLV